MVSVAEVVVEAKPEGVKDVESDMQQLEKRTSETADELDQTSDELGGLSRKFKGAMTAIIGGLAIGVGGVLSQVPVLKTSMDGLAAVFQSLGLQVDETLRPSLNDVNQELFDLADAIAAGDYEQAKKELSQLGAEISDIELDTDVAPVDFAGQVVGDFLSGFNTKMSETTSEDYKAAAEGFVDGYTGAIEVAVEEFDLTGLAKNIILEIAQAIIGIPQGMFEGMEIPLIIWVTKKLHQLIDDAKEMGKEVVSEFTDGIGKGVSQLPGGSLAASVVDDAVTHIQNTEAENRASQVSDVGGGSDFIGARGNGTTTFMIDGRKLNDTQGRIRKDVLNRRG